MRVRVLIALGAAWGLGAASPASAQTPPPCAPGTPQALYLDGLPERVAYGPPESFMVAEAFEDWSLDGVVRVRVADAGSGRVISDAPVAVDQALAVRLDLDDPPVRVTVTYPQRNETAEDEGGAPPGSTRCTQALGRIVTGHRELLLPPLCGEGGYRPSRSVIACRDGSRQLVGLRWRRWNRDVARARGSIWVNGCRPTCALGIFRRYRVRVTASRIRRCDRDGQRYRYTRLRVRYVRARPPGSRRVRVHRVRCVGA